jgi:uncharacterized FlaG/YvyC family protein
LAIDSCILARELVSLLSEDNGCAAENGIAMADRRKKRRSAPFMDVNRVNATAPVADPGVAEKLQTRPEVAQAVTAINSAKLFGQDQELTFAMDRETRRTVVRLVDRDSRKVIRQIPAESVLEWAKDLARTENSGTDLVL